MSDDEEERARPPSCPACLRARRERFPTRYDAALACWLCDECGWRDRGAGARPRPRPAAPVSGLDPDDLPLPAPADDDP